MEKGPLNLTPVGGRKDLRHQLLDKVTCLSVLEDGLVLDAF